MQTFPPKVDSSYQIWRQSLYNRPKKCCMLIENKIMFLASIPSGNKTPKAIFKSKKQENGNQAELAFIFIYTFAVQLNNDKL